MSEAAAGPDKRVLLVYANYDLTFPKEYSLEVVKDFERVGLNFERRVLPCGHYTTGETPVQVHRRLVHGLVCLSRLQGTATRKGREYKGDGRAAERSGRGSGLALADRG